MTLINHRSYAHNLSSCETKAWKKKKKSGMNGIRTHDLCDTGAVLMGSNPVQAWVFFFFFFFRL